MLRGNMIVRSTLTIISTHSDQKILKEKNCPIFQKVAQTVPKPKKAKISKNNAQFESPKHPHQSTFETLNIPTTNHILTLLIEVKM